MGLSKTALFICPSEFCYNPRILKAARFFESKGYKIHIWYPLLDAAKKEVNDQTKAKFNSWNYVESSLLSKGGFKTRSRYIIAGLIQKILQQLPVQRLSPKLNSIRLNKSLLFFGVDFIPTIVYTNVIDTIGIAAGFRKKGSYVVFDSQEYFKGQFQHDSTKLDVVTQLEKDTKHDLNIVQATTEIMACKLREIYNQEVVRVRNIPYESVKGLDPKVPNNKLKLIWQGKAVFFNSRGVDIILSALIHVKEPVCLYLQGDLFDSERNKIEKFIAENNIKSEVHFVPAVAPDEVYTSLLNYDIGVIGEKVTDENLVLTSSNKLFDYIFAGLAVIAPDIPGLTETIQEGMGLSFTPENSMELAQKIDSLSLDHELLQRLKIKSVQFASRNSWVGDMEQVPLP